MIVPPEVEWAAYGRLAIYSLVVVAGWRAWSRRDWPVAAALVFVAASNVALLLGELGWSGVLGVPFAGLTAWVFVRSMRESPEALKAMLAAKESAWSRERHDLKQDLAVERARADVLQRGLEAPGAPDRFSTGGD